MTPVLHLGSEAGNGHFVSVHIPPLKHNPPSASNSLKGRAVTHALRFQQLQTCIKFSCLQEHNQQQLVHTITVWYLEYFYISWKSLQKGIRGEWASIEENIT